MASFQNKDKKPLKELLEEKDKQHTYSNNNDAPEIENTPRAVGSQLIANNLKPKLSPSNNQKAEENVKRDFYARRRRNLKEDTFTPQETNNVLELTPPNNPERVMGFSFAPVSQPIAAPANSPEVVTVDNTLQKVKNVKPTPTSKKLAGKPPKWTTNYQNVRMKCKSYHLNPNNHQDDMKRINEKLQQLVADNKIKNFHPTPQGFKIVLHQNDTLHFNPQHHEIVAHDLRTDNAADFVNLAAELDIVSLDISEANKEEQHQLYSAGQEKNIEMKGLERALEELVEHYAEEHLIPGFTG